jgi:hypothetical protein
MNGKEAQSREVPGGLGHCRAVFRRDGYYLQDKRFNLAGSGGSNKTIEQTGWQCRHLQLE